MSTAASSRSRLISRLGLALLGLLVLAELVCRFVLGLGTPPIYITDRDYEYLLKPGQDLRRFGNHIVVNQWGMRAPDFPATKTAPDELRVMVFGDSVVNGGSQIDHSELSTTLLQQALQKDLKRPVTVGNISAGSWGPGNWLAFARRHGFFGADVVLLVLGSGDVADNPTFSPLDTNHPDATPVLALQEAVVRYLPRFLPVLAPAQEAATRDNGPTQADIQRGLNDLAAFLDMARAEGRRVIVIHHPDRQELLDGRNLDGFSLIRDRVATTGVGWLELAPIFRGDGARLYRDAIHHTEQGQAVMASSLERTVLDSLKAKAPAAAGMQPK